MCRDFCADLPCTWRRKPPHDSRLWITLEVRHCVSFSRLATSLHCPRQEAMQLPHPPRRCPRQLDCVPAVVFASVHQERPERVYCHSNFSVAPDSGSSRPWYFPDTLGPGQVYRAPQMHTWGSGGIGHRRLVPRAQCLSLTRVGVGALTSIIIPCCLCGVGSERATRLQAARVNCKP